MKSGRWIGPEKPFDGGSYSGCLRKTIAHEDCVFNIHSGTHGRPDPNGGHFREEFRSVTLEFLFRDKLLLILHSTDLKLIPCQAEPEEFTKWVFAQFSILDLRSIIHESYMNGRKDGRKELQSEFKKLLER